MSISPSEMVKETFRCTFVEETLVVGCGTGWGWEKGSTSETEVRHVSYTGSGYGRVIANVEDRAEGDRDREMRLFEFEKRSKVPEKEVMATRTREGCGRMIWRVRLVWWGARYMV